MKKSFKILTIVLVLSFIITGCSNDDPTADFKKPRKITITKNKSKVSLTYDNDGKYAENKVSKDEIVLINSSKKFRMDFMYGSQDINEQKKSMKYAMNDDRLIVIDKVNFNGYKGYVAINKKYGTADIYLYIDNSKDIVVDIRISTTNTTETLEELKKSNPKDVLYAKEDVQSILKTINYEK